MMKASSLTLVNPCMELKGSYIEFYEEWIHSEEDIATNVGSEKTIRKNGGVEDTVYIESDGNVVKRFWIEA